MKWLRKLFKQDGEGDIDTGADDSGVLVLPHLAADELTVVYPQGPRRFTHDVPPRPSAAPEALPIRHTKKSERPDDPAWD